MHKYAHIWTLKCVFNMLTVWASLTKDDLPIRVPPASYGNIHGDRKESNGRRANTVFAGSKRRQRTGYPEAAARAGSQVRTEPWQGEPQRRFSDLDKGHTLEDHPGDLGIFFMFIHVSQDLEQHVEQCQRMAPVGWRKLYNSKCLSLLPYGVLQWDLQLAFKRIGDQRSPSFSCRLLNFGAIKSHVCCWRETESDSPTWCTNALFSSKGEDKVLALFYSLCEHKSNTGKW